MPFHFYKILDKTLNMKIYQIDCSARKKGSASRDLAKKLLNKIEKMYHNLFLIL